MIKGEQSPAAIPADRTFADALATFNEARRGFLGARDEFNKASLAHVEATNAIPLPRLMQGPAPVVTDRTPIAEIERALKMTIVGPHAEHVIAGHMAEITEYHAAKEAVSSSLRVDELGEAMLAAAEAGEKALAALVAIPSASIAELALKLQAAADAPEWGDEDHLPALACDANLVALREAGHG